MALGVRQLVRRFAILFTAGLVLGLAAVIEVGRKHGESISVLVAAAFGLATILASILFVLGIGPLWRRAKQIAAVVRRYGIAATYDKGVFRYELELPVPGPADRFLRDSEAFVRRTFTVRALRKWEDHTRLTAAVAPFVSALRHQLDMFVVTRPDGRYVARLVTQSLSKMPIAPPIDLGGVAMIVYLANWIRGTPLPVGKWPRELWQAVVSSAVESEVAATEATHGGHV